MRDISRFGNRSQLGSTLRNVADARGNKDGIPSNEASPAGSLTDVSLADRQPLLNTLGTARSVGVFEKDAQQQLSAFVDAHERAWGQKVTQLDASTIPDFTRFKGEKAAALVRFGRTPSEVTEGFYKAEGSVDGQRIAPRNLFWQHWAPVGKPSGLSVLVLPGFLQSGRSFYEQVDLLTRQGHDVYVMDQQWAGNSSGKAGGIDRGFGITRDVAAMTAFVADRANKKDPAKPHRIVLAGTSMGGGAGATGAIILNEAGKVQLKGLQMPMGVSAVLQSPYFAKTKTVTNTVLSALGRVPLLKSLPLPALGLPTLSRDPAVQAKFAGHVASEKLVARAQAFNASDKDLARIRQLIDEGHTPQGRIYVVHGDHDPLANPEATAEVVRAMGSHAKLRLVSSPNHIFEENPAEQRFLLDGLRWVCSEPSSS
jgi:pimeloyl-ACP methyl ester carboxylesterase